MESTFVNVIWQKTSCDCTTKLHQKSYMSNQIENQHICRCKYWKGLVNLQKIETNLETSANGKIPKKQFGDFHFFVEEIMKVWLVQISMGWLKTWGGSTGTTVASVVYKNDDDACQRSVWQKEISDPLAKSSSQFLLRDRPSFSAPCSSSVPVFLGSFWRGLIPEERNNGTNHSFPLLLSFPKTDHFNFGA